MFRLAMLCFACSLLLQPRPGLAAEASESPASSPLAVGSTMPAIPLPADLPPAQAKYLGLGTGAGPFTLESVQAPVIIVEVFSMYCPYCQREAPVVNELHRLTMERKLDGRIKIVGIGAGNSAFEVETFRKKYDIPFPLIPDPSFTLHKALGEVGTPFFYILGRRADGARVVADTHLGRLDSAASFLDRALQAANAR